MQIALLLGFVLVLIVTLLLVWLSAVIARHTRAITFFFYICLLGNVFYLLGLMELGANYCNFIEGLGSIIDGFFLAVGFLPAYIYSLFSQLIVSILSLIVVDINPVKEFLSKNIYFYLLLPGISFLLSAIFIRKKKKNHKARSVYSD